MIHPLTMNRREALAGTVGAALAVASGCAFAQNDRPLRMYVGFPPGGSGDLFARILADAMREDLQQPILVENKPGAGGMTVAVGFLRAPKDGNHLMLATGSTAVAAPISRAKAPYRPIEDFQWLALLSNAPFVVAVNPSLPVRTLPELVEYAKARPGKLSYGHAGLGTTVYLAGELLKDRAGINVVDVAYAGSAPAITDTIAGNVQYVIETTGTLGPYAKAGKLRIITCMAEAREKIAPDVPTSREAGYDLVAGTYNLLAVPAGTPPEAINRLAQAASRAMEKPAVQERLASLGITPVTNSSPEQARAFMHSEVTRWSAVTKKLGIAL
ncbi:MAG: tripartite tricarboxylate transporter substrate binding protein [Ottowia sp.]|uniref:Bug family tripartite tricarboxylate transporter substrate binding protein n=1 Tax=Ottowia sp. TaxID=1898956 RepID=UPI003C72959B